MQEVKIAKRIKDGDLDADDQNKWAKLKTDVLEKEKKEEKVKKID